MAEIFEQRNLLWGSEVVARDGKRRRVVHVDESHVGFATALALVVTHGQRVREMNEVPKRAHCPRCGCEGPTEELFGVRRMDDGRRRPQSWCRDCRAAPPSELTAANTDDASGWLFSPDELAALSGQRRKSPRRSTPRRVPQRRAG
ncbi:MAG: hypothetical protein ACKVPX_06680 [Myxococcaceae bacterium]